MNKSPRSSTLRVLAVLSAVAAIALASPPSPADAVIWSFGSVSSSGGEVTVTLHNSGAAVLEGRLIVQAVVGDAPIWSFARVSVLPGHDAGVSIPFPGIVASVVSAGFVSDAGLR